MEANRWKEHPNSHCHTLQATSILSRLRRIYHCRCFQAQDCNSLTSSRCADSGGSAAPRSSFRLDHSG